MAEAAAGRDRIRMGELVVSSILRYGVLVSMALIACGVLLLFASGHTGYTGADDLGALRRYASAQETPWPRTLDGVVGGAIAGRPYALILLGLLLLIATPVLRVAVSVVLFLVERDYTYVAITLFVLGVLVLSFFLGTRE